MIVLNFLLSTNTLKSKIYYDIKMDAMIIGKVFHGIHAASYQLPYVYLCQFLFLTP